MCGALAFPGSSGLCLTVLNRRSWQQVAALSKESAMTAYILLVGELTGKQVCHTFCRASYPGLDTLCGHEMRTTLAYDR